MMNSTILKNNLQHLHIINRSTLDVSLPDNDDFELITTKNNMISAIFQNKYLHSKYDPTREHHTLLRDIEIAQYDAFIIFEMGVGHIADSILKMAKEKPVIIIQGNKELSHHLLCNIKYYNNAHFKRAYFFIDPDIQSITQFLYSQFIRNPKVIVTQAAKTFYDAPTLHTWMSEIANYHTKMRVNYNTLHKFKYRWLKNALENTHIDHIQLLPLVTLKNILTNTPILLCAAGPSLEEHIDTIRMLKNKMPIICVDTALSVLHAIQVSPDFVITVDPQYINSNYLNWHLEWAIAHGAHLVTDLSASQRILHLVPPHTKVFTDLFSNPIINRIFSHSKIGNITNTGGSVSTVAWELCRIMGCKNIYTTGLDLSYYNNKYYSKGTFDHTHTLNTHTRLKSIDTKVLKQTHLKKDKIKALTHNNSTLYTDSQLLFYAKWFEHKHLQYNHIHTYTLTKNSMKITGIMYYNKENLYTLRTTHINTIPCNQSIHQSIISIENIKKNLRECIDQLHYIKTTAHEITHMTHDATKTKILEKLRTIEDCTHTIKLITFLSTENISHVFFMLYNLDEEKLFAKITTDLMHTLFYTCDTLLQLISNHSIYRQDVHSKLTSVSEKIRVHGTPQHVRS